MAGVRRLVLALPSFFYENDDVDVTFGERFRAWWEGQEIASAASGDDVPDVDADMRPMRPPGTKPISTPRETWSTSRRAVAQMIWGEGFTLPGGEDYVRDLVNAFSLTPADSALEFGAGMGGGTAAIVGRFGAYMTCFERDSGLRDDATTRAITLGIDDKVNSEPLQDKLSDLRGNFFLGALVREVLCTVQDKEDFLTKIIQALKAEGQLVVTDLIFEPDADAAELEAWRDAEPEPVYPTTVDDVRDAFTRNNVVVRTAADESDEYRAMVVAGWGALRDSIDSGMDPLLAEALVREAELWARRIAAIDAGVLRYYRFVGVKSG